MSQDIKTTTTVLMAVARLELMPVIPTLANIEVKAAKIADNSAKTNHISDTPYYNDIITELKEDMNMKKIASFTVNHNLLAKGMYISRIDGDVITYDIRMKKPNNNDYISNPALHTIEHLFATYARNSAFADQVLYVGPMGCRTGFYLLLRDSVSHEDAIGLVKDSMAFIRDFEGRIPGYSAIECGNYLEHDLVEAKEVAADMLEVLKDYKASDLSYQA